MGLIVETVVFIAFERSGQPINLTSWQITDQVFISAVTVSERLVGVHRADTESRRAKRNSFVGAILANVPVSDFTADVAQVHAEIHAQLIRRGEVIGAHDLIIAATARRHNAALLTDNVAEFARVDGLTGIPFQQASG